MTNIQTNRTLVHMYGNPVATLGTFPAGFYTQASDACGNTCFYFFSSDAELMSEDLPDFTYWFEEFSVDENTELAYPQLWSELAPA